MFTVETFALICRTQIKINIRVWAVIDRGWNETYFCFCAYHETPPKLCIMHVYSRAVGVSIGRCDPDQFGVIWFRHCLGFDPTHSGLVASKIWLFANPPASPVATWAALDRGVRLFRLVGLPDAHMSAIRGGSRLVGALDWLKGYPGTSRLTRARNRPAHFPPMSLYPSLCIKIADRL